MAINKFNPQRVNPDDEDYDNIGHEWASNGKPRKFNYGGVHWMMITDTVGICFVPVGPEAGGDGFYDSSSFQKIHG